MARDVPVFGSPEVLPTFKSLMTKLPVTFLEEPAVRDSRSWEPARPSDLKDGLLGMRGSHIYY